MKTELACNVLLGPHKEAINDPNTNPTGTKRIGRLTAIKKFLNKLF